MTTEAARAVMVQYFDTMNSGGDLGRHMTDDVVWTTSETGEQAQGPVAVTRFIRALHGRMADVRTRTFAVTESVAILEGDCLPAGAVATRGEPAADRVPYAVVYDIGRDRIAAMRLYMQVSRLTEPRDHPG